MWYDKRRPIPVLPPNRMQTISIRIMIVLGVLSMGLFFWEITKPEYVGYKPLYIPLVFSLFYIGFRLLYEWYHYWSISFPPKQELKSDFKVDIFTTYVPGEPYDMLIHTLEAIQKITYPHTTYLCDEGDDPYLKEQCERLGIVHVYRGPIKKNAKAGNINHAIYTHATGDICLILDPDHVPAPDFLDWVLPQFENPEIGFVQVVQAYGNIYENLIAKASSQQTFQFYGPIMMSMNSYGTAQAIGANCTFRRKALDSIGGHAAGLAEDMHTSMQLHAKGWKSVYVPRVLTRGLVPNTLSAYYQQQLKWSRGVFELLVTSYPKLFSKLSWRQKLHYGLLPWHYFMGFLFMINFLVPIISLFSSHIPMRVGLAYFLAYAAPLLIFIITIRHFVQRWVMEEDERGFHIQGGLIAIGTWWIHSLGFIYTLLRRKIPYNPTPKDGQEENTWGINIPNLAMAALSIAAIAYGLIRDLNPYSLIMAGFAAINVVFIAFVFFASMQNRWRAYKDGVPWLYQLFVGIWKVKDWFWKVRHGSYQFLRIVAVPVALLMGFFLYYTTSQRNILEMRVGAEKARAAQHLIAQINAGEDSQALFKKLNFFSSPNEIRTYLQNCTDTKLYPYLHWTYDSDSISFVDFQQGLAQGRYDDQLDLWLGELKQYGRPCYISPFSYAHTQAADSILTMEKDLWRYMKEKLNNSGLRNLLLIYRSPSPERIWLSYPGPEYIDFIELPGPRSSEPATALEDLNQYLIKPSFLNKTPWILSYDRVPSLDMLPLLKTIREDFSEFNGLVFSQAGAFFAQDGDFDLGLEKPENPQVLNPIKPRESRSLPFYDNYLLACNYYKGLEWENTKHPLFRKVIKADFEEMKSLGISHVHRYGPSIYDANLLKEAEADSITISYCFFVDALTDYDSTQEGLISLEETILETIEDLRDEPSIVAWHLGGPAFNNLDKHYFPPKLIYEQEKLIAWLNRLSKKIKAIDPYRPLSVELDYTLSLPEEASALYHGVQGVDAIGLNLKDGYDALQLIRDMDSLDVPLFIHSVGPDLGVELAKSGKRVCFNSWQDDVFGEYVSLDGLINLDGYKKKGYAQLENFQNGVLNQEPFLGYDGFEIVPFIKPTESKWDLPYTTVALKDEKWLSLEEEDVYIEWYLLKMATDTEAALAEPLEMKKSLISLTIPNEPHRYQLIAYLIKDGYALEARSKLTNNIYLGPSLISPTREEIEFQIRKRL